MNLRRPLRQVEPRPRPRQRHTQAPRPRLRVAVLHDSRSRAALADWSAVRESAEVIFFSDRFQGEDELVERLAGFDIVCSMRELQAFDAGLLARLPRLRLLVASGEANRVIDFHAAAELGIEVAATPNGRYGRVATAELAWGLVLATWRGIVREDRALRHGRWQSSASGVLRGRTIGIVGLGGIGRIVAQYAHAFGLDIVAWSPHLTDMAAAETHARRVSFDELLACSDIVSLHLVLSDETARIIDAAALAQMRFGSVLVNTARGGLVDEQALVAALRDGPLAAAGLDVFVNEPLPPGHPLLELDNVVLSPHVAGFTDQTIDDWYQGSADAVNGYLRGEPPRRHRNWTDRRAGS